MANGVPLAKEQMILGHLRLVVWVAWRYVGRGLDLCDLVQEGNLALMRLVDRFEPEQDIRFATYAVPQLRWALLRALRDHARLVAIPHRQQEALARYRKAEERGDKFAEIDRDELVAILQADEPLASLDVLLGDDLDEEPVTLADLLVDPEEPIEDLVCARDDVDCLRAALAALPGEQREVMQLHHFDEMPFLAISRRCGHPSADWAFTRHRAALARLRELAPVYGLS